MQCTWYRPSNFLFGYDRPKDFVRFAWNSPTNDVALGIVIYRVLATLFLLANLTYGLIEYEENDALQFFGIYLTNISYLLLCFLQATLALLITALAYTKKLKFSKKDNTEMPFYLKFLWFGYDISMASGVGVTLGYWIIVFDYDVDTVEYGSLSRHGLNAIYILIEVCITGVPMRVLHFYIPMIYAILYFIGNYAYVAAGGTDENGNPYAYSAVQWKTDVGKSIGVVAQYAAGVTAVHIILSMLTWVRDMSCCSATKGKGRVAPASDSRSTEKDSQSSRSRIKQY